MIAITQIEDLTIDLYREAPKKSFYSLLILMIISKSNGEWVSTIEIKAEFKTPELFEVRISDTQWLIERGYIEETILDLHRKVRAFRITNKVRMCNSFDLPLLEDLLRVGIKTYSTHRAMSALGFYVLIAVYHRKLLLQSEICAFCPVKSKQNIDRILRSLTEIGILITVKAEGSTGNTSKNLIFKGSN